MKKITFGMIFIIFLYTEVFSIVSGNGIVTSYNGNGSSGSSSTKSVDMPMKDLVILGAGYFLKSHSDFQLFLYKVEMVELNGCDYDELKKIIDNAASGMENALATYRELRDLAYSTPYNPEVIKKLKTFDYAAFQSANHLNGEVFQQVQTLLSRGNVTGVLEKFTDETGKISDALNVVEQSIEKNFTPEITRLWELNQRYSDTLLFGQYIAMVFREIN